MNTHRLVSKVALSLFVVCLTVGIVHAENSRFKTAEAASVIRSERPTVEVMFVLDTTSSMTGLIAAAKDKIWSIANTLAAADPPPDIRMGLVGYRDRGDAYVTVLTPLSDDLDAMYAQLMQFQAIGGGDAPESVNQALDEAVTQPDWRSGPSVYRVIFLVGDAPPKMNYQDDVKYRLSCDRAANRDIIINTIQCGNMTATEPVWREIAQRGKGQYFKVAQSGSAVLYDTPYDDDIAALSRDLDATRIYYGGAEVLREAAARQKTTDEIYRVAKPAAVAKRTIFNSKAAGVKNFVGSQELVHAVETEAVDLAAIPRLQLPAELQNMNARELAAHIDSRRRERKRLQADIDALANQRQAYIAEKVRHQTDKGAASLDTTIYECIQSQAAGKGIAYTDGPVY